MRTTTASAAAGPVVTAGPDRPRRRWPTVVLTGLALWAACVVVTFATGNPTLVPTLILLGSFLVPVTFVVWCVDRWRDADVTTELVVSCFVVGGVLGTLGASVLETYLLHPSPWLFVGVGLVEESAKLAALLLVTRRMRRRHGRDGVLLGAATGFGFAAFESAGYAFTVLLSPGGSLTTLVQTELLRGALAPLGHGLWTAILGGVVFHRLSRARPGLGAGGVAALFGVAALHALWDSMRDLALIATYLVTGSTGSFRPAPGGGVVAALTPYQQDVFASAQIGGLAVVSLAGVAVLALLWRHTRDEDGPAGLAPVSTGEVP